MKSKINENITISENSDDVVDDDNDLLVLKCSNELKYNPIKEVLLGLKLSITLMPIIR